MEDERTHRPYWWISVIALLLVGSGAIALFALRGNQDDGEQRGRQRVTVSETQTLAGEPETAEMPDLRGMDYRNAVEQALAAGFFPNSFPAEATEERGTVVDQAPGAGARVVLGSTVRIDISRGEGSREEQQVPDLTGLELPDALRACAEVGFTCRAVPAGGAGRVVTAERPVSGGSTDLSQIELSTG